MFLPNTPVLYQQSSSKTYWLIIIIILIRLKSRSSCDQLWWLFPSSGVSSLFIKIRLSSFIKIVNRQHSAVLQSADFYLRLDIVRGEGLAHVCFCSLTCSGSAGVKLQFFSPIRWHWTILPTRQHWVFSSREIASLVNNEWYWRVRKAFQDNIHTRNYQKEHIFLLL